MNTLLFLIIGVPIVEIYLFIKVGSQIGAFNTISLIFITAFLGTVYARYEGFNTLKSGMSQIVKNELPLYEIISGGMFRHTIKEESKYTGLMKEIAVLIGAYYRVGDAVIPSFMFEISNFALGISYDINVSSLKEASNGAGAMEISFRYLTPNPFRSTQGSRYTPML